MACVLNGRGPTHLLALHAHGPGPLPLCNILAQPQLPAVAVAKHKQLAGRLHTAAAGGAGQVGRRVLGDECASRRFARAGCRLCRGLAIITHLAMRGVRDWPQLLRGRRHHPAPHFPLGRLLRRLLIRLALGGLGLGRRLRCLALPAGRRRSALAHHWNDADFGYNERWAIWVGVGLGGMLYRPGCHLYCGP